MVMSIRIPAVIAVLLVAVTAVCQAQTEPMGEPTPQAKPDVELTLTEAKLMVVQLTIQNETQVLVDRNPSPDSFIFQGSGGSPQRGSVQEPSQGDKATETRTSVQTATLSCEDISIESKAGDEGKVSYKLSCEGYVWLLLPNCSLTGTGAEFADGKLTLKQVSLQIDNQVFKTEVLECELNILGVSIHPAGTPHNPEPGRTTIPNGSTSDPAFGVPTVSVPGSPIPAGAIPFPGGRGNRSF